MKENVMCDATPKELPAEKGLVWISISLYSRSSVDIRHPGE